MKSSYVAYAIQPNTVTKVHMSHKNLEMCHHLEVNHELPRLTCVLLAIHFFENSLTKCQEKKVNRKAKFIRYELNLYKKEAFLSERLRIFHR